MKQLNFFGQFYGDLGIPIHAREFAKALSPISDLSLIPISPNHNNYKLDKDLSKLIKAPKRDASSLLFWYPNSASEYLGAYKKNILYYVFEYTIIPKQFIQQINELDAVCTPSAWGRDVLKKNGVHIPIHVIPGGVNRLKFNGENKKLPSVFRFLHIGKAENRKGTKLLIESFSKAFCGDENIRLSLYIDNVHVPGFSAEEFVKELGYSVDFPLNNIDIKHWIPDIKVAYATHHCAVFPTKAEGIGLPIVEAMASEIPTIVSYNTGITEYANEDNCILLKDLQEEPVYDHNFFPNPGEFGTWMAPQEEELIEKMRWVYRKYDTCLEIAKNAGKFMKENYSWEKSANKFMEII